MERYDHFHGDSLTVECPTGSGQSMTPGAVARDLAGRLSRLFVRQDDARPPCHGEGERFDGNDHWKVLVLFHEYFHGDTGRGLGASHQTRWTALVTRCLEQVAATRER